MQRIGESELILTPDKRVYHLNLLPEELATTVITVGDPARVERVSGYFDRIEYKNAHREFISHTGYIGKKRLTVVSSGIGPDNTDIVLNELDALANIDFSTRTVKQNHQTLQIIRLGTSGSLQADVPVDSHVVASHGLGLDNLLHFYRHTPNEEEQILLKAFIDQMTLSGQPITPYVAAGSIHMLNKFTEQFYHGITVTAPGFYAPQGRVLRAQLAFPDLVNQLGRFNYMHHRITNFEMETSAIYGLGKLLGHQCLSINTIIANRPAQTFSNNPDIAVERMIQKALAIIETI